MLRVYRVHRGTRWKSPPTRTAWADECGHPNCRISSSHSSPLYPCVFLSKRGKRVEYLASGDLKGGECGQTRFHHRKGALPSVRARLNGPPCVLCASTKQWSITWSSICLNLTFDILECPLVETVHRVDCLLTSSSARLPSDRLAHIKWRGRERRGR